jgi:hypothetical protein
VDANETATNAIAAVWIDQNESDSDAADVTLQTNIIIKFYSSTNLSNNERSHCRSSSGCGCQMKTASNKCTAVQADVDQNESDSDAWMQQTNINTFKSTFSNNLTSNTAIAAVQLMLMPMKWHQT